MKYIITRCDNPDELYHFGVKGMKWGHRKATSGNINYYGKSGNRFKASNGLTIGAPNSAGVAAFRKVQGTKVGAAALNGMAKANTAFYGRGKNKSFWKNAEKQVHKENEAVREANRAHKSAKKAQKAAKKAYDKMAKQKVNDLYKKYGDIEDQIDYGHNADKKKNAKLENEMIKIQNEINKYDKKYR